MNDIAEYIAKDSVRYAEFTVEKLFHSTEILEKYPYSGVKVPEFNDDSLRQLIRGNYRIVYLVVNKHQIDILTVHNCARSISNTNPFKD